MLSLDKAQISLVIAMRPCQPFPCIARNSWPCQAGGCCWYHPTVAASQLLGWFTLPISELSFSPLMRVMWAGKDGCACRHAGKIEVNEQASNRKLCHPFAPQGYVYKAFAVGLHETVSHITGTAFPWVTLCCEVLPFLFSAPQQLQKTESKHCTRDFSSSLVIMTIVAVLCSHTILQKSLRVSGSGPCVAM